MIKVKSFIRIFFLVSTFSSVAFLSCKKENVKNTPPVEDVSCKNLRDSLGVFQDVPNLDFELWYKGMGGKYEDPAPSCFWATANIGSVVNLGTLAKAPETVFKVADKDSVHSGQYAARLVTGVALIAGKEYVTAGAIASGEFKAKIGTPEEMVQSLEFGKKFNKRPKTITGWYMYFPVEGDSASAYCYVTKNLGGNKVDTLGFSKELFYDEQNTYKQFKLSLDYKSNETPDNIVIYFSSSEGGDKFEGRAGSTLYLDDLHIEYHD